MKLHSKNVRGCPFLTSLPNSWWCKLYFECYSLILVSNERYNGVEYKKVEGKFKKDHLHVEKCIFLLLQYFKEREVAWYYNTNAHAQRLVRRAIIPILICKQTAAASDDRTEFWTRKKKNFLIKDHATSLILKYWQAVKNEFFHLKMILLEFSLHLFVFYTNVPFIWHQN